MKCGGSVVPIQVENEGSLSYQFIWPNLEVVISEMPKHRTEQQLLSFENYIRNNYYKGVVPKAGQAVIDQVRATKLVVGVVARPDFDVETRAESIVGAICDELHAMMFFNDQLYSWDGQILVPSTTNLNQ